MHPDRLPVPPELWRRPDIRHALSTHDMGAFLRSFRKHTGTSQSTIGARTGLAQSDISAIERGIRRVTSAEVLARIATGLNIPPHLLALTTTDQAAAGFTPTSPPSTTMVSPAADQEDDVRRRSLITGTVTATFLASTTSAQASAPSTTPHTPLGPLEQTLFEPVPASPVPPADLAAALIRSRAAFASAHYTALGAALPSLLAAAEATRDHATSGRARDRAHAAVARGYVLATELAVKQHSPIAWTTADRALTAARASGDPQVIAAAARMVAITMRRVGRALDAAAFLARTASALTSHTPGDPPTSTLAAATVLLLTAGYSAGVGGDRTTALDLLGEADETQHRVIRTPSDGGLFTHKATQTELAMYRISTYTALGTPDDGITHARSVDPTRLPTPERTARYLTDSARMWNKIGDPHRTFTALRAIERTAAEELRRPALRTLTTDLLHAPRHLPGLREFAARHGAIV
ncbi:helix-turn-helix domain-containing protein [Streptomyces sp. NPDC057638]|uniref:helix-turn-helix domain-containing protein n=1 Tax=Streptomyces sp. NPDC057638 TaxID=3346190 RepID=UPI0036AE0937